MAFYGDKNNSCLLAGVNILLATEEKILMINSYIDTEIKLGGFISYTADEYYDFYIKNQNELVLKKFPVIEITELYTKANTDSPLLIDSNSYVVDLDSGILQLINTKTVTGNGISIFPLGFNSIRVKYTHGFSSIPSDIANFATLSLARYLRMEDFMGKAGIIKSFKIGNFSETYGTAGQTPWDKQLFKLEITLKAIYAEGV